MGEKMKAIVCHAFGDHRFEMVEKPTVGPGEVLIQVGASGICAADRKMYHDEAPWQLSFPFIPGHEFAGDVVELGEGAGEKFGLKVGDKAIAELNIPCRACYYCHRGFYNLCDNMQVFGVTMDGGWAQYMKYPANAIVHRVPQDSPDEVMVYVEPLAEAIHGVERAQLRLEDFVVIAGTGPIGLGMLQVARLQGPQVIVVLGRSESKLRIARDLGADYTFSVAEDQVVEAIMDLTGGRGADVFLEASGNPEAIGLGFSLVRKRGRLLIFGVYGRPYAVDWNIVGEFKELDIIGGHLAPNAYPLAIGFLAEGLVKAGPIVTHAFPLQAFREAIEETGTPSKPRIKAIFKPWQTE